MGEFNNVNPTIRDLQKDITELVPPGLHNELFNIQLDIVSQLDLDTLLRLLVKRAQRFFEADLIILFLYDRDTGLLKYEVDSSEDGKSYGEGVTLKPGDGAAGKAFLEKRSVTVERYRDWDNKFQSGENILEAQFAMAIPLFWGEEEKIGSLTAARFSGDRPFSTRGVLRLEAFGLLASIAIRNARDREIIVSLNKELLEQNKTIFADLSLAENTLYRRNQELLESLKQNEVIQKQERKRIAAEMHDNTLQLLYSTNSLLEASLNHLKTDQAKASEAILSARDVIEVAELSIRRAISNLRETKLHDSDFIAAMRSYINKMLVKSGLAFAFEVDGEQRPLEREREAVALRIVQEAVQNVVEHSQADRLSINVHYDDEKVSFRIEDNGIGAELHDYGGRQIVKKENHYGMQIMFERSEEIGANLQFQSRPGKGMAVLLVIPYD